MQRFCAEMEPACGKPVQLFITCLCGAGVLLAGLMWAIAPRDVAQVGALRSRPMRDAAVLGAVEALPGNAGGTLRAECRPALTPPARGGCKIWRSGWKNALGAGRTKELDLEGDEEAGGSDLQGIAFASLLPHVTTDHPCALSASTRLSAGGFVLMSVKAPSSFVVFRSQRRSRPALHLSCLEIRYRRPLC
jgi:hypothetical protein